MSDDEARRPTVEVVPGAGRSVAPAGTTPHHGHVSGTPYPLRTERLLVRMPREDDVDALTAYRNDPHVARLQDWELPYPPRTGRAAGGGARRPRRRSAAGPS